jgi:membrane-bound lytic murein transglycosylase D
MVSKEKTVILILKAWIIIISAILIGCSSGIHTGRQSSDTTFTKIYVPDKIYLSREVRTAVDSLYLYYQHALNSLQFKDTLGARIYFENAFGVMSDFDDETKSTLSEWSTFDSLFKKITADYKTVFPQEAYDQQAEEVLEELAEIEEETFGDSTSMVTTPIELNSIRTIIPLEINPKVELAIRYFQTRGRKVFTTWLERSGRYEQLIRKILKEQGLPEELFYLAMIESGLNPKAYSYARAAGIWQFIKGTSAAYGLRSSWWIDERKDPLLSTQAAAKHLLDLYGRFGDWYLALAGYNCNPKKIESRMRQYKTDDFWQLKRLPRQTRNYIPTFIAASILAANPQKYGFYVDKMEPITYDTVTISECIDLEIIAQCADTTFEAIKELNPAILRWCTPPDVDRCILNIPQGKREVFLDKYIQIPDESKRSWVRHIVKKGETLSDIAQKYGTTVEILKTYNKLNGSFIRVNQDIVLPVPKNKNYYTLVSSVHSSSGKKRAKSVVDLKGYKKVIYIVKAGDTVGEIAEKFNTRATKIREWNGMYYGQYIYPDQKLEIWVPESSLSDQKEEKSAEISTNENYHTVTEGETLWDIAQHYGTSIDKLKAWNNKKSSMIKPGERLKVRDETGSY